MSVQQSYNPAFMVPGQQGGPSAMRGPLPPKPLTDSDLVFEGRYPDLRELIPERNTYAGLWYCYVPAEFLGPMMKLGLSELQGKQGGRIPPFKVVGDPKRPTETTVESVLLMTYGEPILGTQGNGKRRVLLHPSLIERTGINPDPSLDKQNGKVTPEMIAAAKTPNAQR
jgi:hypothetical protein